MVKKLTPKKKEETLKPNKRTERQKQLKKKTKNNGGSNAPLFSLFKKKEKEKKIFSLQEDETLLTETKAQKNKPTKKKQVSLKDNSDLKRKTDKVKEKDKKYRFLVLQMYSYRVFNYFLKGQADRPSKFLQPDNIQIGYNTYFSKNAVTKFYVIKFLPEETPVALMNYLAVAVKGRRSLAKISLQMNNKKYTAKLTEKGMLSRLETWSKYEGRQPRTIKASNGQEYNFDNREAIHINKMKRMLRSYYKIRDSFRNVNESELIIKLRTADQETMGEASVELEQALESFGITYDVESGAMLDFIRGFMPVSKRMTIRREMTKKLVMTNSDLAHLIPFRQGKIGTRGLWLGNDADNGNAVWMDLSKTSDAKNFLVFAMTGSGKSAWIKGILNFHLNLGHNIFLGDEKGTDYVPFTEAVKGVIISQTKGFEVFFNSWKLPTSAKSREEALRDYNEMFDITLFYLKTIVNPEPENSRAYINLIEDFITFVFNLRKVEKGNLSTYHYTHDLVPVIIYDLFLDFKKGIVENVKNDFEKLNMLDIMDRELKKFYHPDGTKHELFSREVDLDTILNSKVVCFDYGVATSTKGIKDDVEENLKRLTEKVVKSKFIVTKRALREITVSVDEELPSLSEEALSFVAENFVQGRSKNMVNYGICNSESLFTKGSPSARTILDSTNVIVAGKLSTDSRKFVIEKFELKNMENTLEQIVSNEDYLHHFVVNSKIGGNEFTSVVKMIFSKKAQETKFIKSVDIKQEN